MLFKNFYVNNVFKYVKISLSQHIYQHLNTVYIRIISVIYSKMHQQSKKQPFWLKKAYIYNNNFCIRHRYDLKHEYCVELLIFNVFIAHIRGIIH